MALIGFSDLRDNELPTLWDADEIAKVRLADGSNFAEMASEAQTALSMLNAELLAMPHYSALFSVQDEPQVEYGSDQSNSVEEATEYGTPDPARGLMTGHMLPIKPYDFAWGWTMMALRKARRATLQQHVKTGINAWRKKYQQLLLTRFFSSTANAVAGTSGADVPFADGGTADSTYVPPESPDGETFLYTHNHFLGYSTTGITSGTFDNSALSVAVEHLQEHGYEQPYVAICSRADVGEWADVTGFKPPNWQNIQYHYSAVERAQFGDMTNFFGAVETDYGIVLLWATPRLPTENFGVFPMTPEDSEDRPLRMRVDPNFGYGVNVVPGNWINAPSLLLVSYAEFGIGVGNRVGGVCVDLGASSWTAPTIS